MKILWFTGVSSKHNNSYGGGGWIRSLASELSKRDDIQLATAYFYDDDISAFEENGYMHIPMYRLERTKVQKFRYNWDKSYRKSYDESNLIMMKNVIEEFTPDIIQVFGTESVFTPLIGKCQIPIVLYLQGMLNPIYNAYYPNLMNDSTIKSLKKDKAEFLFNNGLIRRYKDLKDIADRERRVFKDAKYVIGRTSFDYRISRLYAPQSQYFKLNEMMRKSFYVSPKWEKPFGQSEYHIFSTLSGVTYKGFDVILRTAKILKDNSCHFKWHIAGLNKNHSVVRLFEKFTRICSDDVGVTYLGVLNEGQLIEQLSQSDVMVHPSYIDNSPNSVCEAQLLGLPVIACYVGGVPDFIEHEVSGLLMPTNDPYTLASYLMKDISEPYLYKYSEIARKRAFKRHNSEMIVTDAISIYKNILNQNDI